MVKVRNIDREKQDDQPVVANPFKHISLFPGFVPTQETIDYVNARFGDIGKKPHHRMGGNGMSLSLETIEDAKEIAAELIMKGLDRGEIEFTPGHPLVVTTDKNKVGNMSNFEMGGKRFYVGFE